MNQRRELLLKLIEDTKTLNHAVHAKALDEVEYLLNQRETLIGELEGLNDKPLDDEEKVLLNEFLSIEKDSETLLLKWKEAEEEDFIKLKLEKKQLGKSKKAFNQYNRSVLYGSQGSRIDNKK